MDDSILTWKGSMEGLQSFSRQNLAVAKITPLQGKYVLKIQL